MTIDTAPLRLLTLEAAARLAHVRRSTLLAMAREGGWRIHEEAHRTRISLAALAAGLGVPVETLITDAAARASVARSRVEGRGALPVVGRKAGANVAGESVRQATDGVGDVSGLVGPSLGTSSGNK